MWKIKILLFTLALTIGCHMPTPPTRPSLAQAKNWICFYGAQLPDDFFAQLDLAILDPDNFQFSAAQENLKKQNKKPLLIGYVSIGEAEEYRWYWREVKNKSFISGGNPNWSGAHYTDIRDPEWQDLLLTKIIPRIVARGFDGIFLDTLDTAEYLESLDAKKFQGSKLALREFAQKLRAAFPKLLIISNNALPYLQSWGDVVDGALVEDLYTHYDFKTKTYRAADANNDAQKEKILLDFRYQTKKPVFVLLYAEPTQKKLIAAAVQKTRQADFFPYLATVDLQTIGQTFD